MTTLLMMAAITAPSLLPQSVPPSARTDLVTSFPREFANLEDVRVGALPPRHQKAKTYKMTGYDVEARGGLRVVTYNVAAENEDEGDEFQIRVTFLSEGGAPPDGLVPIKGSPTYVQDGQGDKNWVHVESVGAVRFDSRFNLKTPHYAPTTPDTMIAAQGVGKAFITFDSQNRYVVVLTTYLFHKGNRRDYYLLAGTLRAR